MKHANQMDSCISFRLKRYCYMFLWALIIGIIGGGIGLFCSAFTLDPTVPAQGSAVGDALVESGSSTLGGVGLAIKGATWMVEHFDTESITPGHMVKCGLIGTIAGFFGTVIGQVWRFSGRNGPQVAQSLDNDDFIFIDTVGSRYNIPNEGHYDKHSDHFHWYWTLGTLAIVVGVMVSSAYCGYSNGENGRRLVGAGLGAGWSSIACVGIVTFIWAGIRWNKNPTHWFLQNLVPHALSSSKTGKDSKYHTTECMELGDHGKCICDHNYGIMKRKRSNTKNVTNPRTAERLDHHSQQGFSHPTGTRRSHAHRNRRSRPNSGPPAYVLNLRSDTSDRCPVCHHSDGSCECEDF